MPIVGKTLQKVQSVGMTVDMFVKQEIREDAHNKDASEVVLAVAAEIIHEVKTDIVEAAKLEQQIGLDDKDKLVEEAKVEKQADTMPGAQSIPTIARDAWRSKGGCHSSHIFDFDDLSERERYDSANPT